MIKTRWLVGLAAVATTGCAALLPTPAVRHAPPSAAATGAEPAIHGLRDVRGAIELHSRHSHDGTTPVSTIARLARAVDLDFIIITDHNTLAAKPEERLTGRPLVLVGSELSTSAGHLLALFIDQEVPHDQPVERIVEAVHAQGGLAFAAHPLWPKKPWTRWDLPIDGLEIFDFSTMLNEDATPWLLLKALVLPNPWFWRTTLQRPSAVLAHWDRQLATRPLVGISGHDTHAHAGLRPFLVDSFQSGFHLVSTHALATELTPRALADAIRRGRCYVGFDGVADPRPFLFAVQHRRGVGLMGDHIPWQPDLTAIVRVPRRGVITLYRDGKMVGRSHSVGARWVLEHPGVYRVEAFLGKRPWIFSNPIYVEATP